MEKNHYVFGGYGFKKSKASKHCGDGQNDAIIFAKVLLSSVGLDTPTPLPLSVLIPPSPSALTTHQDTL